MTRATLISVASAAAIVLGCTWLYAWLVSGLWRYFDTGVGAAANGMVLVVLYVPGMLLLQLLAAVAGFLLSAKLGLSGLARFVFVTVLGLATVVAALAMESARLSAGYPEVSLHGYLLSLFTK